MKRAIAFCLSLILLSAPVPAFAQYNPKVPARQPRQSSQIRTFTGTLTKLGADKIKVEAQKRHIRKVFFFFITPSTIIVGELAAGKTVRVEYTAQVVSRSSKRNAKKRTAVKITVLS